MINRLLLISMIWLVTDVAAKEIYVDVGKSAGINFTHHNGAEGNRLLFETMGAGYLSGRDSRVHFGLGSHSYVDRLTVKWPSGILQEMKNVPSNQVLVITEPAN